jgi:replicative DNA helicase
MLDQLTNGLQPGDLVIVAGRPSMGKTAFALNMAANAALHAGVGVAVFSLEMSKEQLGLRLLSAEARVSGAKMRSGFLSPQDFGALTNGADRLFAAPIYIDDSPALTALQMRAKARRMKAEKDLGLIVVDYLQLMKGREGSDNREQEISEISRSLKALAKELHIPVLAVAQLNRRPDTREDKRPVLADLRESGAIEQDADVICFIYRDEMYNENSKDKGVAEILVRKHRNGPIGTISLKFFHQYTRFEDLVRAPEDLLLRGPDD